MAPSHPKPVIDDNGNI